MKTDKRNYPKGTGVAKVKIPQNFSIETTNKFERLEKMKVDAKLHHKPK